MAQPGPSVYNITHSNVYLGDKRLRVGTSSSTEGELVQMSFGSPLHIAPTPSSTERSSAPPSPVPCDTVPSPMEDEVSASTIQLFEIPVQDIELPEQLKTFQQKYKIEMSFTGKDYYWPYLVEKFTLKEIKASNTETMLQAAKEGTLNPINQRRKRGSGGRGRARPPPKRTVKTAVEKGIFTNSDLNYYNKLAHLFNSLSKRKGSWIELFAEPNIEYVSITYCIFFGKCM